MIAIIDYGCGNLFSLSCSLEKIGAPCVVTGDAEVIRRADRLILPGVGAFGAAAEKLRRTGLFEVIRREAAAGKPILGICLGMQLLFEKGYEYGEHDGLGLIPGEVCPFKGELGESLDIPHMGWNELCFDRPQDPILAGNKEGDFVYFVHSYYARTDSSCITASAMYGIKVPAIVRAGNVWGMQFHPEKSGPVGLSLLASFAGMTRESEVL